MRLGGKIALIAGGRLRYRLGARRARPAGNASVVITGRRREALDRAAAEPARRN